MWMEMLLEMDRTETMMLTEQMDMARLMMVLLVKMERTETAVLTELKELKELMTTTVVLAERMGVTQMMAKTEQIKTTELMTGLPVKMERTVTRVLAH